MQNVGATIRRPMPSRGVVQLQARWLAIAAFAALSACGSSGHQAVTHGASTSLSTSLTSCATTSSATSVPATSATPPPGGEGAYVRPRPANVDGGTSILTLFAGGHYTQDVGVTGAWSYANCQMTFTETSSTACQGIPGIYEWSFDGSHLRLTVVSDSCEIREHDFPAAPWSKAK